MKRPRPTPEATLETTVEVRRSDIHGRGVFALRALQADEEVGHYTGRRYAPDESDAAWDGSLTYLFGLSDGSVIDGAQGGNATRHITHACAPNVEAVERRAADDTLHLFALLRQNRPSCPGIRPCRMRTGSRSARRHR